MSAAHNGTSGKDDPELARRSSEQEATELAKRDQPAQLVLDLGFRPATGAGDFLLSGCNAAAVALIDRWPNWPHPAAVIVGPTAAGKSHLVAVWQARTNATITTAASIGEHTIAAYRSMAHPALAVEDIDHGIADDRVLFHVMNHAREAGGHLLMTSQAQPGDIEIALPDLRSRLRATPTVAIDQPDEAVLAAVIVKLFEDRQLAVEPNVVAYMLRHIERSFEAAVAAVSAIDQLAMVRQRRVTRPLAAEVLSGMQAREPDTND